MTIAQIPVVVQGTGEADRARIIRSFCKEGAPVEVRLAADRSNRDEALEVWLQCSRFLGLRKTWAKIGYVEGGRYASISRQLDNGLMRVRRSVVNSFFAPLDRLEPQVALELEVEFTPASGASPRGPHLDHLLGRA